MAIFSNWNQRIQQRGFAASSHDDKHSGCKSNGRNRRSSHKHSNWSRLKQCQLHDHKSGRGISVYDDVPSTGDHKSNCDSKSNRRYLNNRYNKCLYPIKALCLTALSVIATAPASADVGGVSATANPIANSSGSVTNQAIQVLQGPYITNTYGNGIQCQGPTMNFTPYLTHSISDKDPFEQRYFEPQYDMRDFEGRTVQVTQIKKNFPWEPWYDNRTYTNSEGDVVRAYEDGADIPVIVDEIQGDGVPDNAGDVIWQKPVRTGEKISYNTNIGFSATLSFPLDGGLQERCKAAADTQMSLQQQLVANKRLDFELARLKNCGQMMKDGIRFHPRSPYAKICADVIVMNKNVIAPHAHPIPKPTSSTVEQTSTSSQPGSSDAAQLGAPLQTAPGSSFPVRSQPSSGLSSQSVSPLLTRDQQEVLQAVPKTLPRQR